MSMLQPKVGVFLCRCAGSMERLVDFDQLVEHSTQMKSVTHVEVEERMCQASAVENIRKAIKLAELDGVVMACCMRNVNLQEVSDALKDVGVSGENISVTNLKEKAVASYDYEEATERAKKALGDAIQQASLRVLVS